MKMKVLLSVIVFTLYTVSYAQNMKMIDTSMPKKAEFNLQMQQNSD